MMKTPQARSLYLAADWLDSYEDDEPSFSEVADWLRSLAHKQEINQAMKDSEDVIKSVAARTGRKPSEIRALIRDRLSKTPRT